jgi:anti-sigma factor ChrR (cupin superfamily)
MKREPPVSRLDLNEIARRPEALAWQAFRPGVEIVRIYGGDGDGPAAALLRYAPGASVPPHEHTGHEHVYVLAGAQEDERGRYPAGAFVVNPPGSAHAVRSPEGCLALVVWERPVRFRT